MLCERCDGSELFCVELLFEEEEERLDSETTVELALLRKGMVSILIPLLRPFSVDYELQVCTKGGADAH